MRSGLESARITEIIAGRDGPRGHARCAITANS